MYNNDTIASLATPEGVSALAVIRVSGEDTHKICEGIVKERDKYTRAEKRKIFLYTLLDNNKRDVSEKATIIKYYTPDSYTGEDMAEIIIHGGEVNRDIVLESLVERGSRLAEPGEYTRRAFLNNKMDLPKAESINKIILCKNREIYKNYMSNHEGSYKEKIEEWRERLERISSYIEAEIEFPEERDTKEIWHKYHEELEKLLKDVNENIDRSVKAERISSGFRIVIAGPVNVGKSTIFNKISGENRAIVNRNPGTTRDYLEAGIELNGRRFYLVDTAGIRDTYEEIERQGIDATKTNIGKANLVVWITSGEGEPTKQEIEILERVSKQRKVLGIINKQDQGIDETKRDMFRRFEIDYITTTMKNGEDIEKTMNFLDRNIANDINIGDTIITTKRQKGIIKELKGELNRAYKEDMTERKAEYIKNSKRKLDEFSGSSGEKEIYDYIFKEFCIGK